MDGPLSGGSAKAGTAGGTLAVVLLQLLQSSELVKTAVLAATGAAVSYLVSMLLKYALRKLHIK